MADPKPLPSEVTYSFSRSPAFRVIYATGLFGGVMPTGDIALDFVVDRAPFPVTVTHTVEPNGRLGKEIAREASSAYIEREVQAEVRIDLALARAMRSWLDQHIETLEQIHAAGGPMAAVSTEPPQPSSQSPAVAPG